MELIFSKAFDKEYKKIKNLALQERILKALQKLAEFPYCGKPLRYGLVGVRSIRVPPFRILYRIEDEKIIVLAFDHRKDAYS